MIIIDIVTSNTGFIKIMAKTETKKNDITTSQSGEGKSVGWKEWSFLLNFVTWFLAK